MTNTHKHYETAKRYIAQGHYVIDTTTNQAVARSQFLKGSNLIQDAENEEQGKVFASIIAAALNAYNAQQGGL